MLMLRMMIHQPSVQFPLHQNQSFFFSPSTLFFIISHPIVLVAAKLGSHERRPPHRSASRHCPRSSLPAILLLITTLRFPSTAHTQKISSVAPALPFGRSEKDRPRRIERKVFLQHCPHRPPVRTQATLVPALPGKFLAWSVCAAQLAPSAAQLCALFFLLFFFPSFSVLGYTL